MQNSHLSRSSLYPPGYGNGGTPVYNGDSCTPMRGKMQGEKFRPKSRPENVDKSGDMGYIGSGFAASGEVR